MRVCVLCVREGSHHARLANSLYSLASLSLPLSLSPPYVHPTPTPPTLTNSKGRCEHDHHETITCNDEAGTFTMEGGWSEE